jgi:hypothetical protein
MALTTLPTAAPLGENATTFDDTTVQTNKSYWYRAVALNTVGDTHDYSDPAINEGASFPTVTARSLPSNVVSQIIASPNAPVLTSVTASQATTPTVTLNWTYTQGVPAATAFNIMRAPAGSANFVQVKQVPLATLTTTDAPTPGQSYNYRVDAVAGALTAGSNVVSVTVPLRPPTNVRVNAVLTTTTSLTINWTPATGPANPTGTTYTARRCTNVGMTTGCVTANVATPTWRATGLTRGTTYYFQVQARNAANPAVISAAAPVPPLAGTTRP